MCTRVGRESPSESMACISDRLFSLSAVQCLELSHICRVKLDVYSVLRSKGSCSALLSVLCFSVHIAKCLRHKQALKMKVFSSCVTVLEKSIGPGQWELTAGRNMLLISL